MLWSCASTVLLIGLAVSLLYWSLLDHFRREDAAYVVDKIAVIEHQLAHSGLQDALLESSVVSDPLVRKHSRIYLRITDVGQGRALSTPGFAEVLGVRLPDAANDTRGLLLTRITGSDGAAYLTAIARATTAAGRMLIELAYNNSQADALLADYRRWLILVLGATAAACVVIGYALVRNAMRPLHALTARIEAVSSSNLDTRIAASDQPAELKSLTAGFNNMLDRLDQSFQRVTRFSSDIAHELRTPLNNIMGMVEVSLQLPRSSDEYQDVLSSSQEEVTRLARLIDKLLFLARSEHPHVALVRQHIDVGREIAVMHAFYLTSAEEAGVRFTCASAEDLVMDGERDLFHSAVGNLIENSLTYTRPGGAISVSARREAGQVAIRVRDTGEGIAPEHLDHVFDRLYRADPARSNASHSGLGLAIVRTITHLHGGSIALESRLGHGTEVTLRFPAQAAQEAGMAFANGRTVM